MPPCGSCNKKLLRSDELTVICCSSCPAKYHQQCLNLSADELKSIRSSKNTYCCPACKANNRERLGDSTPVRGSTPKIPDDTAASGSDVSHIAGLEAQAKILSSFSQTLQQLQDAFIVMKREMLDFTQSLNSTSSDISMFRSELNNVKEEIKELDRYKSEVTSLRTEVKELRQELQYQNQRQFLKDVEINGITEHRGENLAHIVSVVATTLGAELDPRDIDDVRRVGVNGGDSGGVARPRPIILTMTRRAPRDILLRAARVRRGLTSDKLDIPGKPSKVFLNEHLTRPNRVLYSKSRATGRELGFKFVWTKDGNIFMRRTETSPVLRVTSESILDKLNKDRSNPASPPPFEQSS